MAADTDFTSPQEIEKIRDNSISDLTDIVRKLVEDNKATQKQISKALNTSEAQISRILNRDKKNKTADQLIKVAAAIGYKISFKLDPLINSEKTELEKKFKYADTKDVSDGNPKLFKGFNTGIK